MPATVAGMQTTAQPEPTLTPGSTHQYELAGTEPVRFFLEAPGTVRITVENLGRDTILTITDPDDDGIILRAAGWRGPEHYYVAVVNLTEPVQLTISPDDPVSPPGEFRIRVDRVAADDPDLEAERAMTRAADLNLKSYFTGGDERQAAREKYLLAAGLFIAANNRQRGADALFEAAYLSKDLCNQAHALDQFNRAGSIWSTLKDERSLASAENHSGLIRWQLGEYDQAIALFESAKQRRENLPGKGFADNYFYAETVNNLGLVHRESGDARLAKAYFQDALQTWQGSMKLLEVDADNPEWEKAKKVPWLHHSLVALNNIGWANEAFGDIRETEKILTQALALSRHREVLDMASRVQANLGHLKRRTGEMNQAMDLLDKSLVFFTEQRPDDFWASHVHFRIGEVHRDLGDETRALQSFNSSLALRSPECDPIGRARTLHEIAQIELGADRIDPALQIIEEAESLLERFDGNHSIRAQLINLAGRASFERRKLDDAMEHQERAIEVYRSAGDRHGELQARTDRAVINRERNRFLPAIAELKTAADLAREIDAHFDLFRIFTLLGETYLADDDPENAQLYARSAIDLSEEVQQQLVRPILLRDFSSVQRAAFDVLVHVYLQLGQIEQAWLVADDARARHFTDTLRRTSFDVRDLTPEQQERYQFLLQAIAVRAESRTAFLSRKDTPSAADVLRELAPLLDEMDLLQAQARQSLPGSVDPVSLATLQSHLAEGDAILEYYFSPRLSGVWIIGADDFGFEPIEGVTTLESDIDGVLQSVRRQERPPTTALVRLSRKLLGTNEMVTASKTHLIVVPDGPLHYLPFAILPDPASARRDALVSRRKISYLPSIRALLELRARTSPHAEGIAILADPVFHLNDPRVHREEDSPESTQLAFLDRNLVRSAERFGIVEFPRLPGSLNEATAIQEAAGEESVLTLKDTDANRDIVLSGQLNDYRILHFATHGILDAEEPALSGLVLSGVTEEGLPRSRFLRSQDIAGLNLAARLVVLSGCETGLGRPVHGEGLLGLSRAFFYAGAEQVVSTLWQVPDKTTAELMSHFYAALLRDELSVADALRQAQLKIRNNESWSSAFYWAAFIAQGDWQ